MRKFAIILAGGEGRRAGGNLPKQFVDLCGRPMVWWAMKAFYDADPLTALILVVNPGFMDDWELMWRELPEKDRFPCVVSCGGLNRPHSVYNGLLSIRDLLSETQASPGDLEIAVAVHDGARPLVTPDMINRGFSALRRGYGAVPGVKPVSSLRKVDDPDASFSGSRSISVSRADYVEVQTPQIFYYDELSRAYEHLSDRMGFTDDASLAERDGLEILLYEGDYRNMKVTNPIDFAVARTLLREQAGKGE